MGQPLDLRPEEIQTKEQVGWYRGAPVFLVETSGGYSMVFTVRNGQAEMLSVGPHQGIAKGIARKNTPGIQFTDLTKSDSTDENGRIFKKYEELTASLRYQRYGR